MDASPVKKATPLLASFGWTHAGEGVYRHPSYPGQSIRVWHAGFYGNRPVALWEHLGVTIQINGRGCQELEYHAAAHNRRNRVGDPQTGMAQLGAAAR